MPGPLGLTQTQRAFCEEYIKDYNGVQSYMRVSPDASYDSAKKKASEILKLQPVKDYLTILEKERFEAQRINFEHIADELQKMAFLDDTVSKRDKLKAIELLQKQLGLASERLKVETPQTISINITNDESN